MRKKKDKLFSVEVVQWQVNFKRNLKDLSGVMLMFKYPYGSLFSNKFNLCQVDIKLDNIRAKPMATNML